MRELRLEVSLQIHPTEKLREINLPGAERMVPEDAAEYAKRNLEDMLWVWGRHQGIYGVVTQAVVTDDTDPTYRVELELRSYGPKEKRSTHGFLEETTP